MTPTHVDPKELAFIEQALAAADRAQRWNKVRIGVATAVLVLGLAWFASLPSGPELRVAVMIILVIGPVIGFTTAKLRYLIQNNTRLVLQALVALRPQSEAASARPEDR
jgi:hypothetical protein